MLGPRLIDLGNPVSDHPLNRGLVAWWLPLPNNQGGTRLYDITTKRGSGTLTGGPTWVPGPAGFQAIDCVRASTQYATGALASTAQTAWTIACWLATATLTSSDGTITFNGSPGSNGYGFRQYTSLNLNLIADGVANQAAGAGYTLAAGVWTHAVCTRSGGTSTLYVNGVQISTGASGINTPTAGGTSVGARSNGTQPWGGKVTDHQIWTRGLSASEVWSVYTQARRDYPDQLRRYTPRTWSFASAPVAATASTPPLLPQRTRFFYARR